MRRRTTLALVAGGAAAAATGGALVRGRFGNHRSERDVSSPEDRSMETANWYLEYKPRIMRQARFALRHVGTAAGRRPKGLFASSPMPVRRP